MLAVHRRHVFSRSLLRDVPKPPFVDNTRLPLIARAQSWSQQAISCQYISGARSRLLSRPAIVCSAQAQWPKQGNGLLGFFRSIPMSVPTVFLVRCVFACPRSPLKALRPLFTKTTLGCCVSMGICNTATTNVAVASWQEDELQDPGKHDRYSHRCISPATATLAFDQPW